MIYLQWVEWVFLVALLYEWNLICLALSWRFDWNLIYLTFSCWKDVVFNWWKTFPGGLNSIFIIVLSVFYLSAR